MTNIYARKTFNTEELKDQLCAIVDGIKEQDEGSENIDILVETATAILNMYVNNGRKDSTTILDASEEESEEPEAVREYKPNWENIPERFNYVAVDSDGEVYGYDDKPTLHERTGVWVERFIGFSEYLGELDYPVSYTILYTRPE